jgi:hypothetical protein
MEKIDTRRLTKEVRQALRDQVIRLRRLGKKNKGVAEFLGISVQHSSTIWQSYLKEGKKAIMLKPRGCRFGEKKLWRNNY